MPSRPFRAVQVYSGCVIWARDEAELRAAAEEERQRLEEVMRSKRRKRLKNAWQLLVKNVLLDIYVAGMFLLFPGFFSRVFINLWLPQALQPPGGVQVQCQHQLEPYMRLGRAWKLVNICQRSCQTNFWCGSIVHIGDDGQS